MIPRALPYFVTKECPLSPASNFPLKSINNKCFLLRNKRTYAQYIRPVTFSKIGESFFTLETLKKFIALLILISAVVDLQLFSFKIKFQVFPSVE